MTQEHQSVMTHTEYKRLCNQKIRLPLHAARINWKTYTGDMIKVVVNHQGDEERLPFVIVESKGPDLLRRDWLMKLKQDLHMINQVRMKEELTALISRYSDIFQNELGISYQSCILQQKREPLQDCCPRLIVYYYLPAYNQSSLAAYLLVLSTRNCHKTSKKNREKQSLVTEQMDLRYYQMTESIRYGQALCHLCLE